MVSTLTGEKDGGETMLIDKLMVWAIVFHKFSFVVLSYFPAISIIIFKLCFSSLELKAPEPKVHW